MAAAWFTVREAHAGTALGFRRGSGARRGARRTRRRRTHVQPHGSRWTARASGVRRERLTGVSLTRLAELPRELGRERASEEGEREGGTTEPERARCRAADGAGASSPFSGQGRGRRRVPGVPRHASSHAPASPVLGSGRRRREQRKGDNGAVVAMRETREIGMGRGTRLGLYSTGKVVWGRNRPWTRRSRGELAGGHGRRGGDGGDGREKAKRGRERSSVPCRFGRAEGGGRECESGEPRPCLHLSPVDEDGDGGGRGQVRDGGGGGWARQWRRGTGTAAVGDGDGGE
uniref:RNA helicase n=1 Tax=Oryza sativa subsp. japonica TaxID=39947 RepID=Q8W2Y4_ORYSJ|nr:putative RNA helicase [Oryza sativa Japonica Group]